MSKTFSPNWRPTAGDAAAVHADAGSHAVDVRERYFAEHLRGARFGGASDMLALSMPVATTQNPTQR